VEERSSSNPAQAPEKATADFAGQLFFRLWRASHIRTAAALEPLGLTTALFSLINVLGDRDGAIQSKLAAELGIDKSTMVALIDELEARGLARRRPCSTDRRAREVAMTPKGRRVLGRARRLVAETEDETLRGLSEVERRDLLILMRRALAAAPPQSPWTAAEDD
jgi:DNA-binding MarR family transcriptional regulator